MKRILSFISMLLLLSSFSAVAQVMVAEEEHPLTSHCKLDIGQWDQFLKKKWYSDVKVTANFTHAELESVILRSLSKRELSILKNAKSRIGILINPCIDKEGNIAGFFSLNVDGNPDLALVGEESYVRLLEMMKLNLSYDVSDFMKDKGDAYLMNSGTICIEFSNGKMTASFYDSNDKFRTEEVAMSYRARIRNVKKTNIDLSQYDISSDTYVFYGDKSHDDFDYSYDRDRFMKEGLISYDTTYVNVDGVIKEKIDTLVSEYFIPAHPHLINHVAPVIDTIYHASLIKNCLTPREYDLLCTSKTSLVIPKCVVDVTGNIQSLDRAYVVGPPNTIQQIDEDAFRKMFELIKSFLKIDDKGVMKYYGARFYIFPGWDYGIKISFSEEGVKFIYPALMTR